MIQKIKKFIGLSKGKKPTTDFSAFFHNATSSEKKKLLEQVVREANKDQRDLVEKYNRTKTA
jgi:hypothetical protein